MILSLDIVPTPSPAAAGRLLEREAVLVVPARGKVDVLNEVGARIWNLCDGQRSIGAIAMVICGEYEVDLPQAQADTLAFVEDLIRRGVLVVC